MVVLEEEHVPHLLFILMKRLDKDDSVLGGWASMDGGGMVRPGPAQWCELRGISERSLRGITYCGRITERRAKLALLSPSVKDVNPGSFLQPGRL